MLLPPSAKPADTASLALWVIPLKSLEIELSWIDEHVDGHPYGVDLIVPTSIADREGTLTAQDLIDRVPDTHKRHVEHILATSRDRHC